MPPASLRFSCQMPYETNASYLTLFSASLIVFFLSFKKKPQQPVLRPSYHAEQTLYSSAPACSCRNSPQELLGTFPHRSSCWTQCHSCYGAKTGEAPAPLTKQCGERVVFFAHGVYCSWQMSVRSLSGGTHLFHYFFPPPLIWKLSEWARCQCRLWRSSAAKLEFI